MTAEFPTIFQDAIDKFAGIEPIFEAFGESLLKNPSFIDWLIAFNQDDMMRGLRPDGTEIEKSPAPWQYSTRYEAQTIQAKKVKGQVYDRVTLEDTGAFYKGEKVNVTGSKQLRMEDTDPKTDELIAVWGNVLGVSDENLTQFIEIIRPEFFTFALEYWTNI